MHTSEHFELLRSLPSLPGVYFFKNTQDEVIYIGKAINLKNRVSSYFQQSNAKDWKVQAIMHEYASLDYIITNSEQEALLLEAELIQKHKPRFNTLFKTGQPFLYIRVTAGSKTVLPTIQVVRLKNKKGTHFGPFLEKKQARATHNFIMRTFNLNVCNKKIENGCLDFHLDNCAGTCQSNFDIDEYRFRVELATKALKRNHKAFIKDIEQKIKELSAVYAFEKAKRLHEYVENIDRIFETIRINYQAADYAVGIMVATTPTDQVTKLYDMTSRELKSMLGITGPLRTIDCFDISHFQSQSIVGSCVRFTDGKPDKNKFRRFNIKTIIQQDDYAALAEIVSRRYKEGDDLPDLILIDGGKGQRNAVKDLYPQACFASLAKREERLFSDSHPEGVVLDVKTGVGKLLISLRDYAHHFAITFHRLQRKKYLKSDS